MIGFVIILKIEQFVQYNNAKSDCLNINYVVTQGSILGPLLLLIDITDMHAKEFKISESHDVCRSFMVP